MAQFADGSVEFGGGRPRPSPGQDGESAQPGRVRGDRFCQSVVRGLGEGKGLVCRGELGWRDAGYDLQAEPLSRLAEATKGEDATKIGIGAGAGAAIGGIVGGKKGAAQGAVVGGGVGTGVVLATKGREVRLGPGADVTTRLTAPLTVRVGRS